MMMLRKDREWLKIVWIVLMLVPAVVMAKKPLIINHKNIDITALTSNQINRAKAVLHIAYGHTSHGSQLIDGMTGLVGFANAGGKGLALATNIFAWEHRGAPNKLDLHDYGVGADCGYYPQWYNNAVNYLEGTTHSNANVLIWSWCGQMSGKWAAGTLTNEYLAPMAELERRYPHVIFVYMTGHVDHWDDANQKGGCEAIRKYCLENNKVLFDFADIESHDPDGNFYEFPNDNCDYYPGVHGSKLGNWATSWQNSHVVGKDWYNCNSAHSEPLNANLKAYAAWALWCALAADMDRDGINDEWEERYGGTDHFTDGGHDYDFDGMNDFDEFIADTNPTNQTSFFAINDLVVTDFSLITFKSSSARMYDLEQSFNLLSNDWQRVRGQTDVVGINGTMCLTGTPSAVRSFYRIKVKVPQ